MENVERPRDDFSDTDEGNELLFERGNRGNISEEEEYWRGENFVEPSRARAYSTNRNDEGRAIVCSFASCASLHTAVV